MVRQEKVAHLIERGLHPYAIETSRSASCGETVLAFDAWLKERKLVTLAGRLLTIRVHGGMIFADMMDESGKMQIAFKEDQIGEELFQNFRDLMDPGDIVEAAGTLFLTKRGEKTMQVSSWKPLAKALLPLPEKWHGLQDVELRSRERELDLISHAEVRERFRVRSRLLASLRRFLDKQNFMEVETPMLQPIPGGANARPFVTHHHALDMDLYLRVAPELYLKRLIVGGYERVFEIGRCFRNEGIDYAHNPEFTQLELYWAYVSKEPFVTFMENMVSTMVMEATEKKMTSPWPRVTFRDAVLSACLIDIDSMRTEEDVREATRRQGLEIDFSHCVGMAEYMDELFKKTARPLLVEPTWVFDYPVELKPLANKSPDDPTKSASVQLVANGAEIINAFYFELNDPIEQRQRLMKQQTLRDQGSNEAQSFDEDFLRSLEHGMPPTSGMGMGIDRLAALVTGVHSLKEVILFPTLRPKSYAEPEIHP